MVMKSDKNQRSNQKGQVFYWKVHDRIQSFVLRSDSMHVMHELRDQNVIRSCSSKPRQIYEPAGDKKTMSSSGVFFSYFFELGGNNRHLITGP